MTIIRAKVRLFLSYISLALLVVPSTTSTMVHAGSLPTCGPGELSETVGEVIGAAPDVKDVWAEDPAELVMYFFVYDGKSGNKLTGKANVYHYAIIQDKNSDMKGSSIKQDVFPTPGQPNNCLYTDARIITGSGHLVLTIGLYDQNGIGKNRYEKLKQLEGDLEVFPPPASAWTVVGVQALKILTIVPAIWDLVFDDEAIVPRRMVVVYRKEDGGKVSWALTREDAVIRSEKGKIVLSLTSKPQHP